MEAIVYRRAFLPLLVLLAACGQTRSPGTNSGELRPLNLLISPETFLFGQLNTGFAGTANVLTTGYHTFELADDFTVPAGPGWRLQQILLQSTTSQPASGDLDIGIYADAGNVPAASPIAYVTGAPSTTEQNSQLMYEILVTLPEVVDLQPGRYWLTVTSNIDGGEFLWTVAPTPIVGLPLAYRAAASCVSWCSLGGYGGAFALVGSLIPPPALDIAGNGSIGKGTGVATVTGTAECGTTRMATVRAGLQQRQGQKLVEGFAETTFSCTGLTAWVVRVKAGSGSFKSGPANASAETPNQLPSNRTLEVISLK
jgi:hypothetical protein